MGSHGKHSVSWLALALALAVALAGGAGAGETWRLPPQEILEILEAPALPAVSVHPEGTHLLQIDRVTLPPLADLARPMLRLAGIRLDPRTSARHGVRRYDGLSLRSLADGTVRRVEIGGSVDLGFPVWSPNGARFAFPVTREDRVELWVGETATAEARRVPGMRLAAALGSPFVWLGSDALVARVVPKDRGPAPERPPVPPGPVTLETRGSTAPVRTYQDMLADPHDELLFEHYTTSRLVRVGVEDGTVSPLGGPGIYARFEPSPNGRHLLVSRLHRPYSYLIGWWAFPETVEVWDAKGTRIATVAELPLRDDVPIQGVPTGPRSIAWRATSPDGPSELVWLEALDGGDPKREAAHRDRMLTVSVADLRDEKEPREVTRLEHRFNRMQWVGEEGDRALVREYDRDRRWYRTWLLRFDGGAEPRLVFDHSRMDVYGDPGTPVMHRTATGTPLVRVQDGSIFLSGRGASPQGDRPFLDRMDLATLETDRLWRAEPGTYEAFVAFAAPDGSRFLTRFETKTDPPNYYLRRIDGDERRKVTDFEDPAPQLAGMRKELVTYEREDGVPLSATLYLPPGWDGEPVPMLVWAYPREFNDARTAGQVRGSEHRFSRPRGSSHLFLLTQGYAVLDGASMPVIGPPETANDTFREQLVANARAAIDEMVERGVADPKRVAIGGHSYGAFMTANLLAHSDLFAAGVARSGAYNRTLTPFGFQNERRTFWEAPMTYFAMSPFMHVDEIDEPLLLIHGQADNNSGTFPIQSERLYHAIHGHGGTARLVMLPYESHGYRARESVLHALAEMVAWLDRHLEEPRTSGF